MKYALSFCLEFRADVRKRDDDPANDRNGNAVKPRIGYRQELLAFRSGRRLAVSDVEKTHI
jgi:hypothetical protein